MELDEQRNYQARRLQVETCNPPPLAERRDQSELIVQESKEVAPGIWFPVVVHQRSKAGDQQLGDRTTGLLRTITFSKVSLNEPLPADALTFAFPANAEVVDFIRGYTYRTDASGEPGEVARFPNGEAKLALRGNPNTSALPAYPPGAKEPEPVYATQTANLPPDGSLWGWVAVACGALALSCGYWWWCRR